MTGTAAHVTPVVELDHRPIGDGMIGPKTREIVRFYFDIITGRVEKYRHWCTPCYSKVKA
jgi:branched-chain amino acid aminotransferase